MQVISSKENELIKSIKKLSDKKYRDEEKEYIIEGIKLIKEAIALNVKIKKIIINEENADILNNFSEDELKKNEYVLVTSKIFKLITQVSNPQGIIAIALKSENKEIKYDEDIIVVLDDIQDPGNLGTILRTVDSIGLKQVIMSKGTTDAYSPKVVRSTMGAIFRINLIEAENLKEEILKMKKEKYRLMVTSLQAENSIYDTDYDKKIIVIGNEANGVSKEVQELSDEKVKIPMFGNTESLNASVATGIILYEYVRQKLCK